MRDNINKKAVQFASELDIYKVLECIQKGADINYDNGFIIQFFTQNEDVESVMKLLKIPNINISLQNYYVVFHAIHLDNLELVKLFLEHEVIEDKFYNQFLCRSSAVQSSNYDVFNYLYNLKNNSLTYKNNIILLNALRFGNMRIAQQIYQNNEVQSSCNKHWQGKFLSNSSIKERFSILHSVANF